MIKHKEAMKDLTEIAESITSKQWQKLTSKIEGIRGYIDEQEKKDKLLGLYRDYFYALPDEAKLLREDIEVLEEELK